MSDMPGTSGAGVEEGAGRYLIFFHPEGMAETSRMASDLAGIEMPATAAEAESVTASGEWREKDTVVLPTLGIAISSVPPDRVRRLDVGGRSPVRHVRKEYEFTIAAPSLEAGAVNVSEDYLRGFRAGVGALAEDLLGRGRGLVEAEEEDGFAILSSATFRDNDDLTWGLQATGASQSGLTGRGVRVAILDTGFEMQHPDFIARNIVSKSFIAGISTAQDDNGHGTHCLGTLGGPRSPAGEPRYGIASGAELFVGKVMKSNGKGNEGDILLGLDWALQNRCRIVSMSIGKPVARGEAPDARYEEIGAIALRRNCLLIAAAGNDSDRPGRVVPVEMPANSTTVMAVGAINRRLELYRLSNGGINANGGGIDLAGPGVDVLSSERIGLARPYGVESGTSMATPHVAGVAALLMEARPDASAEEIWTKLTQSARRLSLPSSDVGSGLVQILSADP